MIKHKAIFGADRFIPAAQGEKPFCAGYKYETGHAGIYVR